MISQERQEKYANYWHPRYWAIWFGYAIAWLITRLPFSVQLRVGGFFGWLGYHLARDRRHIVETNLALCFPDLPEREKRKLVRDTLRSSGITIIETANAWLRNPNDFLDRLTISGLPNLERAMADGKGVILIGMHFSTLDFCGALLAAHVPYDVMYRRNRNPLFNLIMKRSREKSYPAAIERKDIRSIIRNLKKGHIVWYGPDQDYGRKHSVFAPFFGVSAASITATARLARICGSPLILFTHFRDDDGTYRIELSEAIADFPSGDDVADATRINLEVERAIAQKPEQYWWVHRRFKTRPAGEERPY